MKKIFFSVMLILASTHSHAGYGLDALDEKAISKLHNKKSQYVARLIRSKLDEIFAIPETNIEDDLIQKSKETIFQYYKNLHVENFVGLELQKWGLENRIMDTITRKSSTFFCDELNNFSVKMLFPESKCALKLLRKKAEECLEVLEKALDQVPSNPLNSEEEKILSNLELIDKSNFINDTFRLLDQFYIELGLSTRADADLRLWGAEDAIRDFVYREALVLSLEKVIHEDVRPVAKAYADLPQQMQQGYITSPFLKKLSIDFATLTRDPEDNPLKRNMVGLISENEEGNQVVRYVEEPDVISDEILLSLSEDPYLRRNAIEQSKYIPFSVLPETIFTSFTEDPCVFFMTKKEQFYFSILPYSLAWDEFERISGSSRQSLCQIFEKLSNLRNGKTDKSDSQSDWYVSSLNNDFFSFLQSTFSRLAFWTEMKKEVQRLCSNIIDLNLGLFSSNTAQQNGFTFELRNELIFRSMITTLARMSDDDVYAKNLMNLCEAQNQKDNPDVAFFTNIASHITEMNIGDYLIFGKENLSLNTVKARKDKSKKSEKEERISNTSNSEKQRSRESLQDLFNDVNVNEPEQLLIQNTNTNVCEQNHKKTEQDDGLDNIYTETQRNLFQKNGPQYNWSNDQNWL